MTVDTRLTVEAILILLGMLLSAAWTAINLRIENRILQRIEDLKEWCDARFVRKADV